MKITKYILSSFSVLNALLAVLTYMLISHYLSYEGRAPKPFPAIQNGVVPLEAEEEEAAIEAGEEKPSYTIIAEKNIFMPERKPKEEAPAVVQKPDIVLYGTIVSEQGSYCYVDDLKSPKTTPGRGKRLKILKEGDALGGFIIADIKEDEILVQKGNQSIEINIKDPQKPKKRETLK